MSASDERKHPHPAAVENAVAAALTDQYGFVPLDIRYTAARLAREHVDAWFNDAGPRPTEGG